MDEQQQSTTAPKNQTGPIVAIVGLIVIVVVGVLAYQNMNKPQTQTQNVTTSAMEQSAQPTQETAAKPSTGEAMTASNYKDGTYTAVGHYTSPGGAEELGVTLTIAKGVVTDSTVEVKGTRPMTKAKQTEFSQNYKPQVEGKNIDEINLTKVAGSSLSPKGFNDAVEQIKSEAKA
jgi:Tfp pilus assembly protein PilV